MCGFQLTLKPIKSISVFILIEMNQVILFLLFVQSLVGAQQLENVNQTDGNSEVTWRQILTSECGYKNARLRSKLKLMKRMEVRKRDVSDELLDFKVVNGKYSKIESQPWQVALVTKPEQNFKCGGSIISKYHVLTAAHCFMTASSEIVAGVKYSKVEIVPYRERIVLVGSTRYAESNLEYNIDQLYVHNFHSVRHHRNDIALIKIKGVFEWTMRVFPICLPTENESYKAGRECTISGYGDDARLTNNRDGFLQKGTVEISTDQHCREHNEVKFNAISEGMFCAAGALEQNGRVDSCQGDSGGPLYCAGEPYRGQYVLLGITSFGHECGLKDYPGIYTKVSKYLQWIYDRVEVSLGYGYGDRSELPQDVDVGRPASVASMDV